MAGFADPIAGSGGSLLIPAVQSPNFSIAGKTGWAIMKNGDAYFYNVTAEGDITTSTVIVEGSTGTVLIYSGTPADGNLIIAIAGASGSDGDSNSWPEGVQVGDSGASAQVQLLPGSGGGAAEVAFPVPSIGLSNTPNIAGGASGAVASLLISGPGLSAAGDKDWVQVVLFSNDTSGDEARMEFRYVATGGGVTVTGSYNGTGWKFNIGVTLDSGLAVTGGTTTDSLTVTGNATVDGDLTVDGTFSASGDTGSAGLPNGTISGSSGQINTGGGTAHTHGPGSYAVTDGVHSHAL